MAKVTKTGNPLAVDILELFYKLNERGLLDSLQSDLTRKYKASDGYLSIYKLFKDLVENEIPPSGLKLSDEALAEKVKPTVKSFTDKKQDFYDRILDYVGRELTKEEGWSVKALEIINEVDGLWNLGLRSHAEAQFLKMYSIYPPDLNLEEKHKYTYVVSKIHYYASSFVFFGSYINKKKEHEDFLKRDEIQLIRELERASSMLDVKGTRYAEPEKWQKDSSEFRVFQVMALLAKQRKNYFSAREYVRKEHDYIIQQKTDTFFRDYKGGQRIFNSIPDVELQIESEILDIFDYYLKLEQLHLCILDGHKDEAQDILGELHHLLNVSSGKSRNYLTGLVLYMKLDLQQAQFSLMLNDKTSAEQEADFYGHFLATYHEVDNLEVRMEVNRLILQFFSMPERPDLQQLEKHIKILDRKLRGVHAIKLELELLKLFICIENYRSEKKDAFVLAVTKSANESNRNSELLKEFLKKIRKTEFTNVRSIKTDVPQMVVSLEPLRNHKNHIDNMILYWLNQFVSRKKSVTAAT